ncbi:MAG: mucin-2 protein [Nocardioidaceae bacterium]
MSIGILSQGAAPTAAVYPTVAASLSAMASSIDRPEQVSRSSSRLDASTIKDLRQQQRAYERRLAAQETRATQRAVRAAQADKHKLWTTTVLDIWTSSGKDAKDVGELEAGKQVLVTGRKADGRVELVLKGESRWVTEGYLTDEKPVTAAAGLSMAPCPDGSVENGLTDNAVLVYRSVCHAFPQITSYGGWDNHGEHSSGKALDIMTSDVALGNAIAEFLQSHASELHLYDILWRQRIWTPVRASEGWRLFPNRGSATANHFDHVHVSTY